jgi:hypothetical protein
MPNKYDSESLSLGSLTHIRENLNRVFGKGAWKGWELETISDELGVGFNELARDKIHILQILELNPNMFFEDMSFFLHATTVINNQVADALVEVKRLLGPDYIFPNPASDIVDTVAYLLIEDGYSKPIPPFEFVPENRLHEGQTPSDVEAKRKALNIYAHYMDSL